MILRCKYGWLFFFLFIGLAPLGANGTTEGAIDEKRIQLTMRMIGHEILMNLGDCESRVMPIKQVDGRYKIPFESDFSFDPDSIISISLRVMRSTGIASDYFVEMEQCATQEVVHSFEIRGTRNSVITPCIGRVQPKDCYNLFITLLDELNFVTSEKSTPHPLHSKSISFLLLMLISGIIYHLFTKKQVTKVNPNLIVIGASHFDKKTKILSFKKKQVELSHKEAELLSLLHQSANTPVERQVILQNVWGDEGDYVGRTLDVFISRLRKRLEADASVKIVNIRGVGYQLVTGL